MCAVLSLPPPALQVFQVLVRAEGPTRVFEISDSDRIGVRNAGATPHVRNSLALSVDPQQAARDGGGSDGCPAPPSLLFGRCVEVRISIGSVGLSVVDGRPSELLYVLLTGVRVEFADTVKTRKIGFGLSKLEVNNQMLDTPYPVLLEPDVPVATRDGDGGDAAFDGVVSSRRQPVAELSVTLLNSTASASAAGVGFYHVQSCMLRVRALDACPVMCRCSVGP